ncbi:MAG: exodeoxyribonuclease V subunit gamma [Ectothiorhodospiraceae bacterium]|nr:exodeoxyribonuclease V subunit gamma [Ectothiorhodospiraceae bacterium]
MLTIHRANRIEALADALAEVVRAPRRRLLEAETVVVPSAGLGRWLALGLAERLGVAANLELPYPATFVWSVLRAGDAALPADNPFSPQALTWRIHALLPSLTADPRFAALRAYLVATGPGGDGGAAAPDCAGPGALALAERLGRTYDQYLVYRPDWIRRWESGEDARWQAELWRRLRSATPAPHWVDARGTFATALDAGALDAARLPERVSLFAIPALSPGYLEFVASLAAVVEVHLMVVDPCREHWGEIVSPRRVAAAATDGTEAAQWLETGQPLLASLGAQGRDAIDALQSLEAVWHDTFVEPDQTTVLGRLQADVLNLVERGPGAAAPHLLAADDVSLQVHACHGPVRELEVLRDRLLALFERMPELGPSDVLVMAPDMERYAPYVEAVFAGADERVRIPFALADRTPMAESALGRTVLDLLTLADGRFEAEQVLALLEEPALARRYDLDAADLPSLRDLVRRAGVRWGVDETTRVALGLAAERAHSWADGLDRLLLGHALGDTVAAPVGAMLPVSGVEGEQARVAGRLWRLVRDLASVIAELGRRRTVVGWVEWLRATLDRLLEVDDDAERELEALRRAAQELAVAAAGAHHRVAVDLATFRHALTASLERAAGARGLGGGVIFSPLATMRGVPAAVVCVLGLDDGAFPRVERPPGFDLMRADFRRGDRSRRDDDRYLFLETLLSARRVLHLSHVGRDQRDDAPQPPSVVVGELLDWVSRACRTADGAEPRDQVVVTHPLQPFSRRYFEPGGVLASYAADLAAGLREAGDSVADARLFGAALPAPAPQPVVELEALIAFLEDPARALLRERLGLRLVDAEAPLLAHEPFDLDWRALAELRALLLDGAARGLDDDALAALGAASGLAPLGAIGGHLLRGEVEFVRGFHRRVSAVNATLGEPVAVPLDVDVGPARLVGQVLALGGTTQRLDVPGPARPVHRLRLWVRHLALCAARGDVARAVLVDQAGTSRLGPVGAARERLAALVGLRSPGLSGPLSLFPRASEEYARVARGSRGDPIAAARAAWQGGDHARGDRDRPYVALAFRGIDPFADAPSTAAFAEIATTVFGPLRAALASGEDAE